MGQGFKEVASLRGDDKKYEKNFNQIDWSKVNPEIKQKYECKLCNWLYEDDYMINGICVECMESENNESQN